jgi:hypothetical protein
MLHLCDLGFSSSLTGLRILAILQELGEGNVWITEDGYGAKSAGDSVVRGLGRSTGLRRFGAVRICFTSNRRELGNIGLGHRCVLLR